MKGGDCGGGGGGGGGGGAPPPPPLVMIGLRVSNSQQFVVFQLCENFSSCSSISVKLLISRGR